MATCVVFGAGAFGTAMSAVLARSPVVSRVFIYGRSQDVVDGINRDGVNGKILPQVGPHRLNTEKIRATTSLMDLPRSVHSFYHAVPVQQSPAFLQYLKDSRLELHGRPYVNCSKGVYLHNGQRLMTVDKLFKQCSSALEGRYMALSGPSFAQGLLGAVPCMMSLAGNDGTVGELLRSSPGVFVEDSPELSIEAVEWAGAMKNVCALAYGWVEASLDCNTAAAIVTVMWRELYELLGMDDRGSRYSYFESSAGLGDLLLTCGGGRSRNVAYGRDVATAQQQGGNLADLVGISDRPTVEGWHTMEALLSLYGPKRLPRTARIREGIEGVESPMDAVQGALGFR
ncbi:hypothetical protein FOL47_010266 [Perkinsus chesapeaki]|uniref:Glycerol-3-phosphate dehydrogenase [NAD(+)] n=1 Tax=Perkinsus chesapeaki TaxID=330153 RepID=A0A7J6L4B5_PERCH|nr:hypothetical protein FOL47_010266 [Perkinsus chesapeaki]